MEQKITFRISEEEKEKLRIKAKVKGLALASFCRFRMLQELENKEAIPHDKAPTQ